MEWNESVFWRLFLWHWRGLYRQTQWNEHFTGRQRARFYRIVRAGVVALLIARRPGHSIDRWRSLHWRWLYFGRKRHEYPVHCQAGRKFYQLEPRGHQRTERDSP